MKKLLFILITTLVSVSTFSQAGQSVRFLDVFNNTNCEQYFVVFGGDGCSCNSQHYQSGFIKIAPMNTLHLNSSNLATIGFGFSTYTGASHEFISAVRIGDNHHFESSCTFMNGNTLGQPGCAGSVSSWSFVVKDLNCHDCVHTTATWYPDICGGTAKLVFN